MSQSRKMILYAIIPAIIAGAFAIAPKVYEESTKPKAVLVYTITEGPCIDVAGNYRRIFSISIANSGKITLKNVIGELVLQFGKVEAFSVLEDSGLKPKIVSTDKSISLTIGNLHPSEELSIAAMVLSSKVDEVPLFNLRSDEILGSVLRLDLSDESDKLGFSGGLLAGLSVFLMAVFSSFWMTKRISALGHHREDVVFYILVRLGLTDLINEIRFLDRRITYLRTSDVLLSHGLQGTVQDREVATAALKCLLLVQNMNDESRKIVIGNLKTLEEQGFSENEVNLIRKRSVNVGDAEAIRNTITKFIHDPSGFLNKGTPEA